MSCGRGQERAIALGDLASGVLSTRGGSCAPPLEAVRRSAGQRSVAEGDDYGSFVSNHLKPQRRKTLRPEPAPSVLPAEQFSLTVAV